MSNQPFVFHAHLFTTKKYIAPWGSLQMNPVRRRHHQIRVLLRQRGEAVDPLIVPKSWGSYLRLQHGDDG